MSIIIGIDPGKTGAVAIFRGPKLFRVVDCPVVHEKGSKPEFDRSAMCELIKQEVDICLPEHIYAIVESQHAFAQQGGVGNFSAGLGYGLWLGILQALGIGVVLTTSQRWRKLIFTPEQLDWCNEPDIKAARKARRKELSLREARAREPQAAEFLKRKMDDGRAEAILIARAGFRMAPWQKAKL